MDLLFFVVQSQSHIQLFVTLWTAAHQASLSFTISQSLLKLMSIVSMISSNHLILYLVQSLSHVRLRDPMDFSVPGFPIHHQLLELTQTHVH